MNWPWIAKTAQAGLGDWKDKLSDVAGKSSVYQYGATPAENNIANYVGGVLAVLVSLLGVLLLVQVIWAGYEWLTARGDSGKIKEAQNRLTYAIIGVVVLVGLYTISIFVLRWLGGATGYENI